MKYLIVLMAGFMVSACATGYGPMGYRGGYYDRKVGDNKYLVGFKGNGNTSSGVVQDYAFRRAKEMCIERGYKGYVLANKNDNTNTSRAPSQIECSSGGFGNTSCNDFGGYNISRAHTELLVSCTHDEKEAGE